jgi:hypothetical protein
MRNNKEISGGIVKITFDSPYHTYGRILNYGDIAFYDFKTNENGRPSREIIKSPILFKSIVNIGGIKVGRWPIIDTIPLEGNLVPSKYWLPEFGHDNFCKIFEDGKYKFMVPLKEAEGLNEGSIWSPEQIEERLRDYYQGKNNRWLNNQNNYSVRNRKISFTKSIKVDNENKKEEDNKQNELKEINLFIDVFLNFLKNNTVANKMVSQMRLLIIDTQIKNDIVGLRMVKKDLIEMAESFPSDKVKELDTDLIKNMNKRLVDIKKELNSDGN